MDIVTGNQSALYAHGHKQFVSDMSASGGAQTSSLSLSLPDASRSRALNLNHSVSQTGDRQQGKMRQTIRLRLLIRTVESLLLLVISRPAPMGSFIHNIVSAEGCTS